MNGGQFEQAAQLLRQGKVIAYPTEAVWGLGCDPNNEAAVKRILALKGREMDKGLLLVAADMAQIQPLLSDLSQDLTEQLEQTWPGPVTWLLPDPDRIYPAWIKGAHSSVAVRVSAHPIVRHLCTEFGGPIVSTSANPAGEPEIRCRTKLETAFADKIDFVVEGELGGASAPSQIRDLTSGATIR